jgi:hypothetical protein
LTNELWALGPGFVSDRTAVFPGGIINAFSGEGGTVAPGEVVSVYGSGLGRVAGVAIQIDPQTGQLPTSGPGISVAWNGFAPHSPRFQSDPSPNDLDCQLVKLDVTI